MLTVGQVAKQAGVGVEAVRFYERKGVLDTPKRSASGYRQFEPEAVDRIRFVKRAQALGFTLNEIKQLLDLRLTPRRSCKAVKQRAEAKRESIEDKIRELEKMRSALDELIDNCDGEGTVRECTILECLGDDENCSPCEIRRTSGSSRSIRL